MPSNITNAILAQKINDLIEHWETVQQEFQDWITGEVDGGDFSNGTYPLTTYDGVTRYTLSPAQLEEDVSGLVDSADTSATAAAASAAAAATSASTATTQATAADAARVLAETAKSEAETAETGAQNEAVNAATSAADALTSETTAAAWAEEDEDVEVTTGQYSAKHHAIKAAASAAAADADATDAAASAAAAATFDPALYGALADNEVVTGDWSFRDQVAVQDASGADAVTFSHDGTSLTGDATNTTHFDLTNFGGSLRLRDGMQLIAYDTTDTDYVSLRHNGTNATLLTNAGDLQVTAGILDLVSGTDLRIRDSGNTDFYLFQHNGTDLVGIGTNTQDVRFGDNIARSGLTGGPWTGASDHALGLTTSTNDDNIEFSLGVIEGSNNRRVRLFLSDEQGTFGLQGSASSGVPTFELYQGNTLMMDSTTSLTNFYQDVDVDGDVNADRFTGGIASFIVRGQGSNGSCTVNQRSGGGVTASRTISGLYTVTLPAPFSGNQNWSVQLTSQGNAFGTENITINSVSNGSFQILQYDDAVGQLNLDVHCLVVYHGT